MWRSRRRFGVVSAPEMAPQERQENAKGKSGNANRTPQKRQGNVDVEFASFIVDVVFIIYMNILVVLFIRF